MSQPPTHLINHNDKLHCDDPNVRDIMNQYCQVAVRCTSLLGNHYGEIGGYRDQQTCLDNLLSKCKQSSAIDRQTQLTSLAPIILHKDAMKDGPSCLAGFTYAPTFERITNGMMKISQLPSFHIHPTYAPHEL